MVSTTSTEEIKVDRRQVRSVAPVNAPTKAEIMDAIAELNCAARAWNGRGPEVKAKRAIVAQMLVDAGVL